MPTYTRKHQVVSAWRVPFVVITDENKAAKHPFQDLPGWLEHNIQGGMIEARKAGVTDAFPAGQWYLAISDGEQFHFAYSDDYVLCDENGTVEIMGSGLFDATYDKNTE